MPTGMLTKKIQGHESASDEDPAEQQPDRSAADRDRCPDAECLRPLRALLKVAVTIESAAGDTSAAPRPCSPG